MMRRDHTGLLAHAFLMVAALCFLGPFVWIALAAFKTQIVLLTSQIWFHPILRNFYDVLFSGTSDYRHQCADSLIIAAGSTLLDLAVATLAAFSLNRMQWPRWCSILLIGWTAVFHMVPPITLAAAWYAMFRPIGLDNSYTGMILAHATINLPITLWLMLSFVAELPGEILEAARIDGAMPGQILWRIVVPLVRPGLGAAAVLAFIFSWNEFPVALTLTQRATVTVPVGVASFAQDHEIQYPQMAATALLSILPAVVLLLAARRLIVRGLTVGAIR
ncbi:MAG TPA: carbohydrate ABC transporter permease [Acetobacteraceae bacterium]|jgi:multiple sugar transport system permease protein|nr:carbohydrate ABC transporter permease [Acetobacteraceae bacterium]